MAAIFNQETEQFSSRGTSQQGRVVLFLEHTCLVSDHNSIAIHFFSHVGCETGAVHWEQDCWNSNGEQWKWNISSREVVITTYLMDLNIIVAVMPPTHYQDYWQYIDSVQSVWKSIAILFLCCLWSEILLIRVLQYFYVNNIDNVLGLNDFSPWELTSLFLKIKIPQQLIPIRKV